MGAGFPWQGVVVKVVRGRSAGVLTPARRLLLARLVAEAEPIRLRLSDHLVEES